MANVRTERNNADILESCKLCDKSIEELHLLAQKLKKSTEASNLTIGLKKALKEELIKRKEAFMKSAAL